ncbi:MAG: Gfo/Idh/MocA family oxidoreductase [Kiritimatiellae bacterium]|nr:Gfo/Idh/MocA family oxidoreductase [Kiritimatiellia bacterium]
MNKVKNVVVVGTGLIAKFHICALKEIEGVKIFGVCSRSKERAEEFIKTLSLDGTKAFDNLREALKDNDVSLLLVANESGAHFEAVKTAAELKVPVLVEKPIGINVSEVKEMISLCEKAEVQLGCIFQTRWSEEYENLKRRIESGELGKITFVRVDVPWWRDDEYYTKSSWHGTLKMDGGGALINQAIHMVDWLVSLMPEIEDVKSFKATLVHPMEAEDTLSAILRFKGGALGNIYATTASFPGRPKRFEITGSKGTIVLEDKSHGTNRPDQIPYTQHKKAIESFIKSIENGDEYSINGYEALKSIELIERIYNA